MKAVDNVDKLAATKELIIDTLLKQAQIQNMHATIYYKTINERYAKDDYYPSYESIKDVLNFSEAILRTAEAMIKLKE